MSNKLSYINSLIVWTRNSIIIKLQSNLNKEHEKHNEQKQQATTLNTSTAYLIQLIIVQTL